MLMKIAIATDGNAVAPHFGRCEGYTIVEVEDGAEISRETRANPGHEPGALPKLMQELGVHCVICGGAGPRAVGLLAQHGIELIVGVSGPVDDAIARFAAGELEAGDSACEH